MIRTILFFTILWICLIISFFLLIPVLIFRIFNLNETKHRYVRYVTRIWSKFTLFIAGVKVNCKSTYPCPSSPYVIIANHQGYFDIPLIITSLPVSPAFISKKELKKMPFLNIWMEALECLFIDRSDSEGSRKKIMKRLREKGRNPLLLFPEGTRSRNSKLLPFRTGGLKMVFDSKTDVLPVRINNTYIIFEEKGLIKPGKVSIEVLPLIKAENYESKGFGDFLNSIKRILADKP